MRFSFYKLLLSALLGLSSVTFGQKYAMVGDSITAGHNAQNWVDVLRSRAASGVDMENDGYGGATLSRQGDLPYAEQLPFAWATDYNADVVVIMLGTNDAKFYNWISREHFLAEYRALIDYFVDLPSAPEVVLTTPIAVLGEGNFGIMPDLMNGEVVPAIRSLEGYRGAGLIDVYEQFGFDPVNYIEEIHPSDVGAARIAEIIGFGLGIIGEAAVVTPDKDKDEDKEVNVRPMPRMIAEAKDLGSGWRRMDGLGDYFVGEDSWLYHNEMGWIYDASDDPDDLWVWKHSEGWLWTKRGVYPYCYSTSRENWIIIR